MTPVSSAKAARQQIPTASRWPPGFLILAAIVSAWSIDAPNQNLTFLAIIVLLAGGRLLWRPGETPALLLAFSIAWMGASSAVLQANWEGVSIASFTRLPSAMELATTLSLGGVLALAAGMRLGAGRGKRDAGIAAINLARSKSVQQWFSLYLAAFGVSLGIKAILWVVPGVAQLLLGFLHIKWAFYFMLAYASFVDATREKHYLLIAFLLELAEGFGGFFSDFKSVFLVSIAAILGAGFRMTVSRSFVLGGAFAGLLMLGAAWTAVKGEYRSFVSGGTNQQIVTVDYSTRMAELFWRFLSLDGTDLAEGFEQMFKRIAYVEYFGAVLNFVPNVRPHTSGELTLDAISRPFMPRLLFPGKSIIDDTDRTNAFTGGLAGNQPGTSISIGYIGEFYIDFGILGMLGAAFVLGLAYGGVYRWLVYVSPVSSLFGMAIATSILLPIMALDNSFTKLFGGLVASLIAAWMVMIFIVPRHARWLMRPNKLVTKKTRT